MNNKTLHLTWTKHLKTKEERERFEKVLRGSSILITRLLQILEEEEQALSNIEVSSQEFDNPSWAYKQAFRLGEKSRIKKLKDLLSM